MLPFERVRGAVTAAVAEVDERLADTLQLCVLLRMSVEIASGGRGHLLVRLAVQVGEGRVEATLANVFSADDGCDVGVDTGSPVSPDYPPGRNAFNGRVKGVQLAIADAAEADNHLVSPADAIRIALARQ